MIVRSDPDFIDTRLVKQGKKPIAPQFRQLANWINENFNTKVLNVYYDNSNSGAFKPRLRIIFEFKAESEQFRHPVKGYDHAKEQLISDKFKELVGNSSRQRFFRQLLGIKSFETDGLVVTFEAFEPIAREEAVSIIPLDRIKQFQVDLAMEELWELFRQFYMTTFFFYTEEQLKQLTADKTTELLKRKYYDLLKQYDEFDYIKPDDDFIRFDTKENFDTNYESSWFYYSR